tara:strand:+ start:12703 stop:13212 length:510 start_codon:yes stop_codon:yes gene_type:complete
MMKIYLDMDGVLADFFNGFAQKFGKDHWKMIENKEKSIQELQGTDFFNTLDTFPSTMELVNFVQTLAGDDGWGICSSPLKGDRDNSAFWKRTWLTKHFIMPKIENLLFTGRKEQYAMDKIDGEPNVLIDDKPSNIKRWNEKGGIGILYQANQDSLVSLKQKLIGIVEKS